MSAKKFKNYRLYYNFLNALAKELTKFYYKKIYKLCTSFNWKKYYKNKIYYLIFKYFFCIKTRIIFYRLSILIITVFFTTNLRESIFFNAFLARILSITLNEALTSPTTATCAV